MAIIHRATITPTKLDLIDGWLGDALPGDDDLRQVGSYRFDDPEGEVGIEAILDAHLALGVVEAIADLPQVVVAGERIAEPRGPAWSGDRCPVDDRHVVERRPCSVSTRSPALSAQPAVVRSPLAAADLAVMIEHRALTAPHERPSNAVTRARGLRVVDQPGDVRRRVRCRCRAGRRNPAPCATTSIDLLRCGATTGTPLASASWAAWQ